MAGQHLVTGLDAEVSPMMEASTRTIRKTSTWTSLAVVGHDAVFTASRMKERAPLRRMEVSDVPCSADEKPVRCFILTSL